MDRELVLQALKMFGTGTIVVQAIVQLLDVPTSGYKITKTMQNFVFPRDLAKQVNDAASRLTDGRLGQPIRDGRTVGDTVNDLKRVYETAMQPAVMVRQPVMTRPATTTTKQPATKQPVTTATKSVTARDAGASSLPTAAEVVAARAQVTAQAVALEVSRLSKFRLLSAAAGLTALVGPKSLRGVASATAIGLLLYDLLGPRPTSQ